MIMFPILFLLSIGLVLFGIGFWSRNRNVNSQTNKDSDEENECMERPLDPMEETLEELHRLKAGDVCAILKLVSGIPLVENTIMRALKELQNRHPLLRCSVSKKGSQSFFQETFIDCQNILKKSSSDNWQNILENIYNLLPNNENGSLWSVMWLKEKYDMNVKQYENTIIFTCHHSIVDAISVLNIMRQFTEFINAITKGNLQCSESLPMLPSVYTLASHKIDWKPWHKRILLPQISKVLLNVLLPFQSRLAKNGGFFNKYPCPANAVERHKVIVWNLEEDDLQKLLLCTRRHNCNLTSVLSTAFHFSIGDLLRAETNLKLTWKCAVNLRRHCQPSVDKEQIGCFATSLPGTFTVPANRNVTNFWKVAETSSKELYESIGKDKHLSFLRLGAVVKPETLAKESFFTESDLQAGRFNVFTLSNIGVIDWPTTDDVTYDITDARFFAFEHLLDPIFTHYVMSIRGTLYCTSRYNTRVITDTTAEKYIQLSIKLLKKVMNTNKTS